MQCGHVQVPSECELSAATGKHGLACRIIPTGEPQAACGSVQVHYEQVGVYILGLSWIAPPATCCQWVTRGTLVRLEGTAST
jgi:hypothetical protein